MYYTKEVRENYLGNLKMLNMRLTEAIINFEILELLNIIADELTTIRSFDLDYGIYDDDETVEAWESYLG